MGTTTLRACLTRNVNDRLLIKTGPAANKSVIATEPVYYFNESILPNGAPRRYGERGQLRYSLPNMDCPW